MSLSDLPAVVIDENGVLWFNGCIAEQRLAAIDEDRQPHQASIEA